MKETHGQGHASWGLTECPPSDHRFTLGERRPTGCLASLTFVLTRTPVLHFGCKAHWRDNTDGIGGAMSSRESLRRGQHERLLIQIFAARGFAADVLEFRLTATHPV
jgi:hypothetical protein